MANPVPRDAVEVVRFPRPSGEPRAGLGRVLQPAHVVGGAGGNVNVVTPHATAVEVVSTPPLDKECPSALRLQRPDAADGRTSVNRVGDRGGINRIVLVEVDVGPVADSRATDEIRLGPNGVGDVALSRLTRTLVSAPQHV